MDNLYLKLITSYYRGLHLMVNADFWSPWITADPEVCVILGIVNCIKPSYHGTFTWTMPGSHGIALNLLLSHGLLLQVTEAGHWQTRNQKISWGKMVFSACSWTLTKLFKYSINASPCRCQGKSEDSAERSEAGSNWLCRKQTLQVQLKVLCLALYTLYT